MKQATKNWIDTANYDLNELQEFIERLDNVSVVTRYPEDLKTISREFNRKKAEQVFSITRRTLKWLRRDNRLKD
jgi:HEPN domain-containing protein